MISLWPHWQRPYFLILLPIIIYLLWKLWHSNDFKGAWLTLIPKQFQTWLLTGSSVKVSSFPKLLITLASLLALIALMGPSYSPNTKLPPIKANAPLVIVLDMTPRMLATDMPPTRLQSVQRKLIDIIDARKDTQTAMVVYAGSAHTVTPLADDEATLKNLITSLNPNIMPTAGQQADLGINKAIELIKNAQEANNSNNATILLVTTGLSANEQSKIEQSLKGKSIKLDILGVGTAQGAPIQVDGQFLKDSNGNIIIPKLNSQNLQELASKERGYYSNMTLNNADINNLHLNQINGSKRLATDEQELKNTKSWKDQGYYLLIPLLIIAAFAGRKGWLFCVPLLFFGFQPSPAQAFEWDKLLLNKDQQGQKLLQDNNPQEAQKRFKDKQWRAYSAYQAKDYTNAEKVFAKDNTANGIYNYGNVLARQGKYKEAIEQWDKAISAKPNFEQAIVNKKIVEDLLKKQQQQQNQQDQQNQQNSDQKNQDSSKQDANENNQQQNKSSNNQQQSQDSQSSQSNSNSNNQENQQNKESEQQNSTQENQPKDQSNNDEQKNGQQSNSNDEMNDADKQHKTSDSESKKDSQQQAEEEALKKQLIEQQSQSQKNGQMLDKEENSSNNGQTGTNQDTLDIHKLEQEQKFEQQMRSIPNDPSNLLRRKFYYERQYNKGEY